MNNPYNLSPAPGKYEKSYVYNRYRKDYIIRCAGCSKLFTLANVIWAHKIPESLRKFGWRCFYELWHCPECAAKKEKEKKKEKKNEKRRREADA
jgi:hypothetical protein